MGRWAPGHVLEQSLTEKASSTLQTAKKDRINKDSEEDGKPNKISCISISFSLGPYDSVLIHEYFNVQEN